MKKFFFALTLLAHPVQAQQDPVLALRDASHMIEVATAALADAETEEDRAGALTDAIRSLETGLASLRLALREAVAVEAAKRAGLANNRAELGHFLATLAALQKAPPTLSVLHPDGAVASARAGIILAAMTPEMRRRADRLRAELETIAALNTLHQQAKGRVQQALEALQKARNDLAVAIRQEMPAPDMPDGDLEQMLSASDSLDALARQLGAQIPASARHARVNRRQDLPLPVNGTLVRAFDTPNAAGIREPGITIAAPALSLVLAPQAGIVRFAGDFLEYGQVVILEPAPEQLQIYAGFGQVYVNTGDVLESGAAMGLLGGEMPDSAEFLAERGGENDKGTESLYIEIRENGIPVDPQSRFAIN